MEVSSEILQTLLGSGILEVTCLDGSVKHLRGYGNFTTREELGQEEVKDIALFPLKRFFKSLEGLAKYCFELVSFEWYIGPMHSGIIDSLSISSVSD